MARRMERVNVLLRQQISELLARDLQDPRLNTVFSVTHVMTSVDFDHATIAVSVLGTEEERQEVVALLNRASGFLRHQLGLRLKLKKIPRLRFTQDESLVEGIQMLGVIDALDHTVRGDVREDS